MSTIRNKEYAASEAVCVLHKQLAVREALHPVPEKGGEKLAVLFPGTGYTCDRPLLYYARRMAEQNGCDVLPLSYSVSLKRGESDLNKAVRQTLTQVLPMVQDTLGEVLCRHAYRELFFFSKSFGTVAAGAVERALRLRVHQFFLTPLEASLPYLAAHPCYASCGTADPWVPDSVRRQFLGISGVRFGLFPGANHSLEIPGDAEASVRNLQMIAASYADFLREMP